MNEHLGAKRAITLVEMLFEDREREIRGKAGKGKKLETTGTRRQLSPNKKNSATISLGSPKVGSFVFPSGLEVSFETGKEKKEAWHMRCRSG